MGMKSVYKHKQQLVKLCVSFLLLGIGFRLLFSRSILIVNEAANHNTSPMLDSHVDKGGADTCDVFTGDWIPNAVGPVYTNDSCRWIEYNQNCMSNGRPDKGYLYWRWKPKDCDLPQFDGKRFLELMRGKTLALVGDSISRNHVQSLLCILSKVEDAVEVYHDKDYKNRRWRFSSYNFSLSAFWSPFLTQAAIFEDNEGVSKSDIKLHLDLLDTTWTDHYPSSDLIIFSSGKWFNKTAIYYENDIILGCNYCKNLTQLDFNFSYRKVLKKVFNFIVNSNHKGTFVYRTSTPDHFENGGWSTGGDCKRKLPVKEGEMKLKQLSIFLREIELQEFEIASAEASGNGVNLKLLDVTSLSLLRPDGHPGPYRYFHPFAKDKNAKVQRDCLHWCLPGPIDYWNDLLMEVVFKG